MIKENNAPKIFRWWAKVVYYLIGRFLPKYPTPGYKFAY